MRPAALWRHELRRAGLAALLAPPAMASAVAGATVVGKGTASDTVAMALEMAIPLATGVGVASLIGRDPVLELHLSLPTAYRATLFRRFVVTLGWGCLAAVVISGGLLVTGSWPAEHGVLLGQLIWVAPMSWLAGLGLFSAAALRSPSAAAGLVASVWVFEQLASADIQANRWSRLLYLFATTQGTHPADWRANRVALLAMSALLTGAAWRLLGDSERLWKGEPE